MRFCCGGMSLVTAVYWTGHSRLTTTPVSIPIPAALAIKDLR